MASAKAAPLLGVERELDRIERQEGIAYAALQREAICAAAEGQL